ncbi:effector-associated constant component EACC1 [Streptomyces goshikiensis]|uniref:effector-associated constant component EACC1 n=1 Tax=Streptomyces goshikiensis TaxID=1942 RepID=UPI00382A7142
MTVYQLTVEGLESAGQQSLHRLADWLRGDEVVGDQAEVELSRAPLRKGDMGAAFETVQIVVDSGFQLASLIVAIAAWRRTQPAEGKVVIEGNQVRVTLDTDDPEKIRRIAQALEDPS